MPLAIIIALVIVTALYIVVAIVAVAAQPVAARSRARRPGWPRSSRTSPARPGRPRVLAAGAVISIFSVTLVVIYGQTRILFAMARDGMIPPIFHKREPAHADAGAGHDHRRRS